MTVAEIKELFELATQEATEIEEETAQIRKEAEDNIKIPPTLLSCS